MAPNTDFVLFFALLLPLLFEGTPGKEMVINCPFGVFPVVFYFVVYGGSFGIPQSNTTQWGGFLLTFALAFVGILLALPIGILLALGRRSEMPVIRSICVIYIEFWRGTPLITILFMASVMLPLFSRLVSN